MGIFSVKFGGRDVAIVSSYLDFTGYIFSAIFFIAVLNPVISAGGWAWAWIFIAVIGGVAAVMAMMFLGMLHAEGGAPWGEEGRENGNERKDLVCCVRACRGWGSQ